MVRVETNTQTIQNLIKKNTNPNGDVFEGDRISIESDFQRGDEETGVWDKKRKQAYIDSLHKNYPTGIFTFVKDHTNATAYQEKWATLDGGNRFRTIRDYMLGKFDVNGKKYSELEPNEKAVFDNMLMPCQWMAIEREDPPETIAEMFTRLNTSAKPLSQGELIKAHGWRGNVPEIELAKAFVLDKWNSALSNENTFENLTDFLTSLRNKWSECFGELIETKRGDTLAMICGFIISAKTSQFIHFDKRYDIIKNSLSINMLSKEEFLKIFLKFTKLLTIVEKINLKAMLGRFTKGTPSQKNIAPLWKRICEETDYKGFDNKIIYFYNQIGENEDLYNEFIRLSEKGGNSETSCGKINRIIEFIESKTEEID